jgi:hypothetical protein
MSSGRRRRGGDLGGRRALAVGPFAALGLDPAAELTDDDVRNAWRKIAAATHPDRSDGGDPARFADAAAAYTDLRTAFGRGEAQAHLVAVPTAGAQAGRLPLGGGLGGLGLAVRAGRLGRLTLRVVGVVGVSIVALLAAGHRPAGPALVVGALTWLILTARHDVARREGDASRDRGVLSGALPERTPRTEK